MVALISGVACGGPALVVSFGFRVVADFVVLLDFLVASGAGAGLETFLLGLSLGGALRDLGVVFFTVDDLVDLGGALLTSEGGFSIFRETFFELGSTLFDSGSDFREDFFELVGNSFDLGGDFTDFREVFLEPGGNSFDFGGGFIDFRGALFELGTDLFDSGADFIDFREDSFVLGGALFDSEDFIDLGDFCFKLGPCFLECFVGSFLDFCLLLPFFTPANRNQIF